MQIAANFLLVILLPLSIVVALSLRELQRVHGPDTMGPAFFLVVAGVLRWILVALALGLIIAFGRFAGITSITPMQVLLVYAAFFLTDCAAGLAVHATAPSDCVAKPGVRMLGQAIGFGLPLLVIVLLLVRVNVAALAPGPTFALFFAMVIISIPAMSSFLRINTRTEDERRRKNQAYWDNQQRLIAQGKAELDALAAEAPLEMILPYMVEDWPTEVRSDAIQKLEHRPRMTEELLAMLGGPHRDLACAYISQLSDEPSPDLARPVYEAVLQQAADWRQRIAAGALAEDQSKKLAKQCEQASSLSFRFRESPVDFRPVAAEWKQAVDAAPQTPEVQSAQSTLLFWNDRLQREPPPTTAPASPPA